VSPGRRHGRLPGRLFWRVYLNGLALLALVALAVAGVAAAVGRPAMSRYPERFAAYAAARIGDVRGEPERVARELDLVHEAFGAEATVYAGGAVLASSASPPLPPLEGRELERVRAGALRVGGRRFAFAAPLAGDPPAYVLVTGAIPEHSIARGAAFLAAVLLALALASIPLAHHIAAPLERLGRAVRAFGGGDLSARARLRERGEIGEVALAFDQMADHIEALIRREKRLLADVSHELRTPLARIRVALELAAEGDVARSRRFLAEIGADLGELERLVDDVLTAARLDLAEGRAPGADLPLRRERCEPAALVEKAAERFRAAHPERPLSVAVEGTLPPLEADPALLRRALDNLLDNAAKHSGEGAPVELRARGDGDGVQVEVRDRGVGVAPEDLPRLFTPFFRTDRSRARDTGGVGLGLALSKRIVEAHGGRIAAESAPGEGLRVLFSVPAATAR
jgi:signal transduction histidine kinase